MGRFRCDACGAVDETQLTNFWRRVGDLEPVLCSACDPEIGQWHNEFPRREWDHHERIINRRRAWRAFVRQVRENRTGEITTLHWYKYQLFYWTGYGLLLIPTLILAGLAALWILNYLFAGK